MSLFSKSAAALLALTIFAGNTQAIPYASKITVSDTTITAGTGMTISYILNETAGTVEVEIVAGETVVATFAGTTTLGQNQVVWNGTADNASGAMVPAGTYRVRITADKTNAAWTEVTSQRSLGNYGQEAIYNQVFAGWSPNDFLPVANTDNDLFGTGLGFSSYNTPKHAAAVLFDADLSTFNNDGGYDNRVFIVQPVEDKATVANSDMWGAAVDPDNADIFYQTGQSGLAGAAFMRGDINNPATMVSADPLNIMAGILPRSVVVVNEGAAKYAYFTYGNSTIAKVAMNPLTNELTGPLNVITTFADTTRYGRFVTADDQGNIYWTSRQIGTAGLNGILLRWDAATVAGPTPTLTEANATWNVAPPADTAHMQTLAITPGGDVYVLMPSGTQRGIYSVGNTATATITKTLLPADKVVDYQTIGTTAGVWGASTIYSGIRSDVVGNIIGFDRSQEQVRLFAPPVTTSTPITAPLSQTFAVEGSSVADWNVY